MLLSDFKKQGNFKGRKRGAKDKKKRRRRALLAAGLVGAGLLATGATALALKSRKKISVPKGAVDVDKYDEVLENIEKKVTQQAKTTPIISNEVKEVTVGIGDPIPVVTVKPKRGLNKVNNKDEVIDKVRRSKEAGDELAKQLDVRIRKKAGMQAELADPKTTRARAKYLRESIKRQDKEILETRSARDLERDTRRRLADNIQKTVGIENIGQSRTGLGKRGRIDKRRKGYVPNYSLGDTQYAEKVVRGGKTVGVKAVKNPAKVQYVFNRLGNTINW